MRKMNFNSAIGIASLIMSTTSLVWIGGFQYSAIKHDIGDMKEDIKEMKTDIRSIKEDIHKLDVRVNILEQRKR